MIDRYVSGRFFQFFFMACIAALAIYLVVDPIENLDKFLDKGVPKVDIFRYYLLYIPYILYLTYPVAILLATMFCIGGLTSSNELLAMTASGIPLRRHLTNLSIIGLILSATAFYFGETIVPYTNRERLAIWRTEVKGKVDWRLLDQGQVYLQTGPNETLHLDLYQPRTMQGHGVDLYRFNNNRVVQRISAKMMYWSGAGWIFRDGIQREFTDKGEIVNHFDRMKTSLDIKPDDLVELKLEPEEMGMKQLKEFTERIRETGGGTTRWEVDIYGKLALPFAGFIIIFFGVPVSAVRRRSGAIFGVTLSLLISFLYFGIMQVGKVLGYKEILDPLLAAWIGNIIFFIVGIVLYLRAPK